MDGRRVPLWSFAENTEQCRGAISPPVVSKRGHMFRDGYAQLADIGGQYQLDRFHMTLIFAAYSPNGLIYFRGNHAEEDFISIELQDGHIVMQYFLGDKAKLRLESVRSYNDGVTHVLTVTRDKQTNNHSNPE